VSNAASALRISSSNSRVSCRAASRSLSIRCEQSAKQGSGGGGPDVWLGRAAMVGFASAIAVEVATGKGCLQVRVTLTAAVRAVIAMHACTAQS